LNPEFDEGFTDGEGLSRYHHQPCGHSASISRSVFKA